MRCNLVSGAKAYTLKVPSLSTGWWWGWPPLSRGGEVVRLQTTYALYALWYSHSGISHDMHSSVIKLISNEKVHIWNWLQLWRCAVFGRIRLACKLCSKWRLAEAVSAAYWLLQWTVTGNGAHNIWLFQHKSQSNLYTKNNFFISLSSYYINKYMLIPCLLWTGFWYIFTAFHFDFIIWLFYITME